MRIAMTAVILLLSTSILAATNATVPVGSPATNAVFVKVSKKAHKPSRPQCEATTLSGNRCKRHAAEGSKYCSQHTAILRKREKDKETMDLPR